MESLPPHVITPLRLFIFYTTFYFHNYKKKCIKWIWETVIDRMYNLAIRSPTGTTLSVFTIHSRYRGHCRFSLLVGFWVSALRGLIILHFEKNVIFMSQIYKLNITLLLHVVPFRCHKMLKFYWSTEYLWKTVISKMLLKKDYRKMLYYLFPIK